MSAANKPERRSRRSRGSRSFEAEKDEVEKGKGEKMDTKDDINGKDSGKEIEQRDHVADDQKLEAPESKKVEETDGKMEVETAKEEVEKPQKNVEEERAGGKEKDVTGSSSGQAFDQEDNKKDKAEGADKVERMATEPEGEKEKVAKSNQGLLVLLCSNELSVL